MEKIKCPKCDWEGTEDELKDGKCPKCGMMIEEVEIDSSHQNIEMRLVETIGEHVRVRVKNPDLFIPDSFRTIDISKDEGISAIVGKLKGGDGSMVIQSYRFVKDKWTEAQASKWVKDHRSFEENKEVRTFTFGLEESETPKFTGYAARFDTLSESIFGMFREKVAPGAFRDSLNSNKEIKALINHDPNLVLGSKEAKTLRMVEDGVGLKFEIDPPDTSYSKDLQVSVKRGDISKCSFGFVTEQDNWDYSGKEKVRTLEKVRLIDCSIVTFPAYDQTTVSFRALVAGQTPEPLESEGQTPELKVAKARLNLRAIVSGIKTKIKI